MAISLGGGGFSVPTMPGEIAKNVSESVSGVQSYLSDLLGRLPGFLPLAAASGLLLGPFGLVAGVVVLLLQGGQFALKVGGPGRGAPPAGNTLPP